MALSDEYPEIFKEFIHDKNPGIDPCKIKPGSHKNANWRCPKGHEYTARIGHRTLSKSKCPYCSGRKLTPEKSLEACRPDLAMEWDYTKNSPLQPCDVFVSTGKIAHWICKVDPEHKWPSTIDNRAKGNGCPFCAGKRVLPKKSFAAKYPDLLEEWAFDLNYIRPDQIPPKSNEVVYWRCREKHYHVWKTGVAHRAGGTNCPFCFGKRLHVNDSALKVLQQKLLEEWDTELNVGIDLSKVSPKSYDSFYWKCVVNPLHKPWKNRISIRLAGNGRCPSCFPFQKQKYEDSLACLYPELAKEWHKSNLMSPSEILPGSALKASWQCPLKKSHVYQAKIVQRARGHGCPKCTNAATLPELRLLAELKTIFPRAEHHFPIAKRKIDVYLPEIKTAIEWDSEYHHAKKEAFARDVRKSSLLVAEDIQVVRLRHINLPDLKVERIKIVPYDGDDVTFPLMLSLVRELLTLKGVDSYIEKLQRYLDEKQFVNQALFTELRAEKASPPKGRSLLDVFPEIVDVWHVSKNLPIGPQDVYPSSHEEVWWQCRCCTREWPEKVAQRTAPCKKNGRVDVIRCPFCNRKKPSEIYNLAVCRPDLIIELVSEDNPDFEATMVTPNSGVLCKWTCSTCAYKWPARINSRTGVNDTGCPRCNGKILTPERSLAYRCPEAIQAWNYEKNEMGPEKIFANTHIKFYFLCSCGDSFHIRPRKFMLGQRRCKECSGWRQKSSSK